MASISGNQSTRMDVDMKQPMLNSRKWKATLLGIASITTGFIAIVFLLDDRKLSYNGQLTSLYGMYAAAIVSVITAYLSIKMIGEKKSDT